MNKIVYMDNAATTFYKPEHCQKKLEYSRENLGNPFSGPNSLSMRSIRLFNECREKLNDFFNGFNKDNIVFTYSCTHAIYEIFTGIIRPGDHIITTQMEHDSTINILERFKKTHNIEVSYIRVEHDGKVDTEMFKQMFRENTSLVWMNYASSVTGTVIPVKAIADICKSNSVIFGVDASQVAGVLPVDIKECGIDILASSAHKHLFSESGLGFFIYSDILNFSHLSSLGKSEMPNIHGIATLLGGMEYVYEKGVYKINKFLRDMSQFTMLKLKEIDEIEVIHAGHSVPVISIKSREHNVKAICDQLDSEYSIITSAGMQNATSGHKNFGTFPDGTLRISLCAMNNVDEINYLIDSFKKILIKI